MVAFGKAVADYSWTNNYDEKFETEQQEEKSCEHHAEQTVAPVQEDICGI